MQKHLRATKQSPGKHGGVTVSAVLAQFDGSWDIATQLSEIFLMEYPAQLDEVRASLEARNPSALASAAHKIKGSVGIFGAGAAVEAALELEEAGKRRDLAGAREMYRRLEAEVMQVRETLALLAAERTS